MKKRERERERKAKRNNTKPNPGSDSRLIKHLRISLIREGGIGPEASIIFSTFC
ncbi:hypothetical protein BO83DRAFT_376175 [Aspergillus eucalypticola CBS 122712]|uniref:Uncharacterized protein n=1 Tax=Aspergillus eucalypticola (strain CBS 122712 / IBT 29274) TaxID=1448314 RepID=A0A317W076_ASPEC|nr:uncharacterized protein BO83DRAFT_376175 [Aspergillus eucalypticola CBS 122712]PWY78607.1 hypothetical protein BO83DRAFT_376175 [Aspergillus eucalypticola CBS 122712]